MRAIHILDAAKTKAAHCHVDRMPGTAGFTAAYVAYTSSSAFIAVAVPTTKAEMAVSFDAWNGSYHDEQSGKPLLIGEGATPDEARADLLRKSGVQIEAKKPAIDRNAQKAFFWKGFDLLDPMAQKRLAAAWKRGGSCGW